MKLAHIVLVFSLFSSYSFGMRKKNLTVFLGASKVAPYDIHSAGNILANINLLVLGQLIENTDGFEIKPNILESYFYSFETKSYFLKLKDNLIFHNGRKATSKDLEFTLLRGFFSSDKSFFHTYLGNIQGVRDIKKGEHFTSGKVNGVKIIDDLTLEIKLIGQNPSLFHSLSAPYFSLVPREELKDDYLTWKKYPVGVGPYKVEKGFDGKVTIVSRFSKTAKFDKIYLYSSNEKPEYDISLDKLGSLDEVYSKLPMCVRVFDFSNKHPLGRNKNFKILVSSILNRITISDSKIASSTTGILPSHFWGQSDLKSGSYTDEELIEMAKALNLKEISVIVYAGSVLSEKHKYYISKVKDAFDKYGVSIRFEPNPEKFVSLETSSKYSLRFWGIVADYVDPLIMYSAYRKIGHNIHYSPIGADLDSYESLYLEAEKAPTFSERLKTVKKLNEFSQKNIVQVPIAEEKNIFYVNNKTIESLGYQPNPLTLNFDRVMVK